MNPKKSIYIFLVEDNKTFSMLLKAAIESSFDKIPVKLHVFETGEACMVKIKEVKPQVAILDYHLNSKCPEAADGIEVLKWIKKESLDTYVIMLTSEDNIEIALKSFNNGATDYVVKTETAFKKINNSLSNIFKIMDAKSESMKYKRELLEYMKKTKI